jgi:transaldolase
MGPSRETLKIKLFADGADLAGMIEMASKTYISGLTTNPTLMRKAGVKDYTDFARDVLTEIKTKPISLEVFSDEIEEMKKQGEKIASWGDNVYVKIPVTNTRGESTGPVIKYLSQSGVKVNVTAIMTIEQVRNVIGFLDASVPAYVSVFAGRIADTGRDPIPMIRKCVESLEYCKNHELIWASPREVLNIFQANEVGCQIITATNDILNKLEIVGKDLNEYSLETVKMFYLDAKHSEYVV